MDTGKLLDVVFEGVKKMVEPLRERVAALEAETKQLRGMGYAGVYQRALANEYKRNGMVTCNGALWVALKDAPDGLPGQSADWQLVVKSPR